MSGDLHRARLRARRGAPAGPSARWRRRRPGIASTGASVATVPAVPACGSAATRSTRSPTRSSATAPASGSRTGRPAGRGGLRSAPARRARTSVTGSPLVSGAASTRPTASVGQAARGPCRRRTPPTSRSSAVEPAPAGRSRAATTTATVGGGRRRGRGQPGDHGDRRAAARPAGDVGAARRGGRTAASGRRPGGVGRGASRDARRGGRVGRGSSTGARGASGGGRRRRCRRGASDFARSCSRPSSPTWSRTSSPSLPTAGVDRRGASWSAASSSRRAAVVAVEAGALEDHADRVEELAQPALALRAVGERVVGEALDLLEGVAALGAGVLVGRHGGLPRSDWAGRGVGTLRLTTANATTRHNVPHHDGDHHQPRGRRRAPDEAPLAAPVVAPVPAAAAAGARCRPTSWWRWCSCSSRRRSTGVVVVRRSFPQTSGDGRGARAARRRSRWCATTTASRRSTPTPPTT